MIYSVESKPGRGMTLRGGLQFDHSPVPLVEHALPGFYRSAVVPSHLRLVA